MKEEAESLLAKYGFFRDSPKTFWHVKHGRFCLRMKNGLIVFKEYGEVNLFFKTVPELENFIRGRYQRPEKKTFGFFAAFYEEPPSLKSLREQALRGELI